MISVYLALLAGVAVLAFTYGRGQSRALAAAGHTLHSLPSYHGYFLALACTIPMVALLIAWVPLSTIYLESSAISKLSSDLQPDNLLSRDARLRDIILIASGAITDENRLAQFPSSVIAAGEHYASLGANLGYSMIIAGVIIGLAGFFVAARMTTAKFRARNRVEQIVLGILIACSIVAVLTTVGIVFSVVFETLRFFSKVSPLDFIFGLEWSPQTAIRADQTGSSGAFGAVPLFVGTILIMLIAMCVAGPIGLLSAIFLAEYATPQFRAFAKPILEVLAGIPTVVFGFFAALTVAPFVRRLGEQLGLEVASESALAAGVVMGVMIIPFMSSLSDDVINSVPQSLRDGSYAMGATKSETIKRVILPAALPGVVSAFMLSISRAVGETMIVVMAAGLAAHNLSWNPVETFNPLQAVTTVTVQIATLLVGDQEFDSAKTLAAFALGFVLFFFTLILNVIALQIVRRYQEQYD